jgi:ubiquinone/menaquinone biosynthesis C-methylase UbiE
MAGDHKSLWEKKHTQASHLAFGGPTDFAKEVQELIPQNSKLLELGCGHGQDALFFAEQGHEVAATDFSEKTIQANKQTHKHPKLDFGVLDISRPLPFGNEAIDVVYASFSLQYFPDSTTKNIFTELARVLKSGGFLCFICKSTKDFYYGKGIELEKDMYDFNGQIRHFFSEAYTKECLGDDFTIASLESGEKHFYSYPAGFVKAIATKK